MFRRHIQRKRNRYPRCIELPDKGRIYWKAIRRFRPHNQQRIVGMRLRHTYSCRFEKSNNRKERRQDKGGIIIEAANGPTSEEADAILNSKCACGARHPRQRWRRCGFLS